MKKLAIILLIPGILYGCQTMVENPELKGIQNVKIVKMDPQEIIVEGECLVSNPNSFSVDVKEIDIQAFLNETPLAHIKESKDFTIEGNKDFFLPVTITIPSSVLQQGNNMQRLMQLYMGQNVNVRYKGTVTAEGLGVSLTIPIDDVKPISAGSTK